METTNRNGMKYLEEYLLLFNDFIFKSRKNRVLDKYINNN